MKNKSNDDTMRVISKILSSNDTGETGSHQAGTHIPKQGLLLSFFPRLNVLEKNPRAVLRFRDEDRLEWQFSFIYYNNKYHGGTRNEYRLTGMTKYFKKYNLKSGDRLTLRRDGENRYYIDHIKHDDQQPENEITLSNTWTVVSI